MNDPPTRDALNQAIQACDDQIEQLCQRQLCPTREAGTAMMIAAIESALAKRRGASVNVNWLDGWRRPVNEKLKEINAADLPTYRAAMRAVAVGLAQ